MANNNFWQKITPWDEGAGETFRSEAEERLDKVPFLKKKPKFQPVKKEKDVTSWYKLFQENVLPRARELGGQIQQRQAGDTGRVGSMFGEPTGPYSTLGNLGVTQYPQGWQEALDAEAALSGESGGEEGGGAPQIVSIGGYDYEVTRIQNLMTGEWEDSYNLLGRTTGQDEISPYQQENLALAQQRLEATLAEQQADAEYRQQQLAWQREQQQARLAAEKEQRLAQLAASPKSWLEYAALAGQPPVIQPWMRPLMSQEYTGATGEPIPGWGAENMTGMPELTRPSRQYQARMGPTAMSQFEGYKQARTAATPEETQFRLWSTAPPGGTHSGFRYSR